MLHVAVTCCLVAVCLAAPQYSRTRGHSRGAIQASALPRPFRVTKSPYQGGGAGGGGYGGGGGGYGGGGKRYGSKDDTEPANYEFSYEVSAPEYQVMFGHRETRQDATARGSYSVLLPDGRTQVVEYEADEDGYRPIVTYRGGSGNAGYGKTGNSGYGKPRNGGYGQPGNGGYGQPGNGGYEGSGGVGRDYGGNGSYPSKGLSAGKGSYGQKGNGYSGNNGYGNRIPGGYQG